MKRPELTVFLALSLSALCVQPLLSSCSDNEPYEAVDYQQIPPVSRSFISTYFPGMQIKSSKMEHDDGTVRYEVKFFNGIEIEFDQNGLWTDIDMPKHMEVPPAMLPIPMAQYIAANFPGSGVNEISRKYNGYEVELTNGVDLIFDSNGYLIHIDR